MGYGWCERNEHGMLGESGAGGNPAASSAAHAGWLLEQLDYLAKNGEVVLVNERAVALFLLVAELQDS